MTMKYIFILSTLIENKGFSTKYAAKLPEKKMHIPLDSYMLEYIAQKDTKKFVGSPCMKIPAKVKMAVRHIILPIKRSRGANILMMIHI